MAKYVFHLILCCLWMLGSSYSSFLTDVSDILTSHGKLSPAFDREVFHYQVNLPFATRYIAIAPNLNSSRLQAENVGDLPVITIYSDTAKDEEFDTENSMVTHRQFELPQDGKPLKVFIEASFRNNSKVKKVYDITVNQAKNDSIISIEQLSAFDDSNHPITIHPPQVRGDVYEYKLYVPPAANGVRLRVRCYGTNTLLVNNKAVETEIYIPRDKKDYKQLVFVECVGLKDAAGSKKSYVLYLMSDYKAEEIPTPEITLENGKQQCPLRKESDQLIHSCPHLDMKESRVRLIGNVEPTVKYMLESSDSSIGVRVMNKIPSARIPLKGGRSVNITGYSANSSRSWRVVFLQAPGTGISSVFPWVIGLLGIAVIASLSVLSGVCHAYGTELPVDVTDTNLWLTMLLQFVCFVSAITPKSSLIGLFPDFVNWITLFLPLKLTELQHAAINFKDARNAYGCLMVSAFLFLGVLLAHSVSLLRFRVWSKSYTVPHSISIGNWEAAVIHGLCFPIFTGSTIVVLSSESPILWKVTSFCFVIAIAGWYWRKSKEILSAKREQRVTWVKDSPCVQNQEGYWCDTICDQLVTHPVNRSSVCFGTLRGKWVSTVADIEKVEIRSHSYQRVEDRMMGEETKKLVGSRMETTEPEMSEDTSFKSGKSSMTIRVVKTVSGSKLCPGKRLIVGLFRTHWLDVLFTYEGLTMLHEQAVAAGSYERKGIEFFVPLTVKTMQLIGPYTGGANRFFYSGARKPLVKIVDFVFRLTMGVLVGILLSRNDASESASRLLAGMSVMSLATFMYSVTTKPHNRKFERFMSSTFYLSMGLISTYLWTLMSGSRPPGVLLSILQTGLAYATLGSILLLIGVSSCVAMALYFAIVYPVLEETRFLENLSNCSLEIKCNEPGTLVTEVPAYNKRNHKSLNVQYSATSYTSGDVSIFPSGEEVTFQIDVKDILYACRSGILKEPILSLVAPHPYLKFHYRYANIFNKACLCSEVANFLSVDERLKHLSETIATSISHYVNARDERVILQIRLMCSELEASENEQERKGNNPGFDKETASAIVSIEMQRKASMI